MRPLVLVHGLWNTPKLFEHLLANLNQRESLVMTPYLPHDSGRISIRTLTHDLDCQIRTRFGIEEEIDILGFSMGGLVSRLWLQDMNGFRRTRRFFSIGSPHHGTITAQVVPSVFFQGIAEMKWRSRFIRSLKDNSTNLQDVNCRSYFSIWDLMVFPGSRAVLPVGPSIRVPVFTHKGLIKHKTSIDLIRRDLFSNSRC